MTGVMNAVGLDRVRRQLREAVGADTIAALHRVNPGLDALAVLGSVALFAANVWLLGMLAFGITWLALFVLQGFLLQWMGLVSHDLFVHRRAWGETGSWWASLVLTLPRFSLPTGYEQAHLAHHRCLGTVQDTEAYKQHLDTRARRCLFLTLAGIKLAQAGRLEAEAGLRAYHDVSGQGALIERRARVEKWVMRGFLLTLLVLGMFFPRLALLGFLLPVLVMGPVVNTLRIVIEHADVDPANPWHGSTFYRTGPVSRLLFCWDSGDCHLVHHVFPRLPFYRMGRAVDLMRPHLLAQGVVERRSYAQLLKGWFVDAYPHRTLWPLADKAAAAKPGSPQPLSSLSNGQV
ncbi:MAG: fatty acid desaturase-like protein [Moraxellaceae bacterium]|nr:fatty acid desaturase-like protein [Moraxellaceae bacterium]